MLVASEDGDVGLGHRERRPDRRRRAAARASAPSARRCRTACSVSMLPVSGAWQLIASGAMTGDQPEISATAAYSRLDRPGELRQEEVPQPAPAGLGLQVLEHRAGGVRPVLGEIAAHADLGREDLLAHEVPHPATASSAFGESAKSMVVLSLRAAMRRSGVAPPVRQLACVPRPGRRRCAAYEPAPSARRPACGRSLARGGSVDRAPPR